MTSEIEKRVHILETSKMVNTEKSIKKKPRERFGSDYKFLSVSYPVPCERRGARKRYQIELRYRTPDGKKHQKTILFGKTEGREYIDNGD